MTYAPRMRRFEVTLIQREIIERQRHVTVSAASASEARDKALDIAFAPGAKWSAPYTPQSGDDIVRVFADHAEELRDETVADEGKVKLDRKTRGQVTRTINRLQTVESREFPSSSNPHRSYRTVIYQDGKVLCNCQGWTMKRGNNPRQCRHTAELIDGRQTRTDGEFIYIESLAHAAGTLSFSEEGGC